MKARGAASRMVHFIFSRPQEFRIGRLLRLKPVLAAAAALALAGGRVAADVGESAVITLVFPYGTAGNGLGEAGVAVADDASAPFYNPAHLGFQNPRWRGGEASWFFERVLPAIYPSDVWHTAVAGCYQPSVADLGGFSMYINYLNLGVSTMTDEFGRELGSARSREFVAAGAWGVCLGRPGEERNAVGVAVKYVHSARVWGIGPASEGIGRTFAVDAGYLYRNPIGIRVGAAFLNMGPAIFYISRDEADPIPFEVNLGVGYDREFTAGGLRVLRVRGEHRLNKEFVQNYIDKRPDPFWKALVTDVQGKSGSEILEEIMHHIGVEAVAFNTAALRFGCLLDFEGERKEMHLGTGVNVLNHFAFDYSVILEPGRAGRVREGQWSIGFSLQRMFYWPIEDFRWWEAHGG